jgi:PhzF family phenazine biosynthesis protein
MRIRIVDAFSRVPFAGNPAGVLVLDQAGFPSDDWLQRVAAELNLSESAFLHPLPQAGEAHWALRWFTPATEVDLCGHATLAAAHVLATTGSARGTVRFTTRSGVLTAAVGEDGAVTLDFPSATLTQVPVPEGLGKALDAGPVSVHGTGALGDLLVELTDETAVRTLSPDLTALGRFAGRGVVVTARAQDPAGGHDFVSRGFYPGVGVSEDPVTGSAHTALAPFWSARLGRSELTGFQASARGGHVRTALRGPRTLLTGHAVTVVDGELQAPPPLAVRRSEAS